MRFLLLTFSVLALFAVTTLAADKPKTPAKPKPVAKKPAPKPKVEEVAIPWPPEMKGAVKGTITFSSPELLVAPQTALDAAKAAGAEFEIAKKPPTVELALHRDLGPEASKRRLWSSWGDIGIAADGRVYCAIGDHGDDQGGDARCFIYCWDPQTKELKQIVDMNKVVPPKAGRPSWSKVHAKVDEGKDGKIYFCCTLNDGNRAKLPSYGFDDELTGGQIYQYDPATGKTIVYANLPARRCTATSLLDRERNIWWCNLEAGEGNALWGYDLGKKKEFYKAADGSTAFNRAFALLNDGSILLNGPDRMLKFNFNSREIEPLQTTWGDAPGMRCATRESSDGFIYGVTYKTAQLFRYNVRADELKLLGPVYLSGGYTTVMELSPDEKYFYFLPGAHGKAAECGTPIIRYERATGKQTIMAFLAPYCEKEYGYVPGGTYGMKLSADGRTIYVNFNGHMIEGRRPERLRTAGFGCTGFAAIHLPAE
jgi:hypothetical protein